MTTVTRTFNKEGRKNQKHKQQIVWMKMLLQKKPKLYYQRIILKINNDTTNNQNNWIESEILKIGPLKDASKTVQLKDDRKYISINNVDKLQDNLLNII